MTSFQCSVGVKPVKTSGSLGAAATHQERKHLDAKLNIDAKRTKLNMVLIGTGDVIGDVNSIVGKHKKAHPKTTECAEMVLTANHKWFDEISPGWKEGKISPKMQEWINKNVEFLQIQYPGVASAILHLDEEAPHIHAMVVPLATYNIKYRRGEKEVTRIAYNEVFGDSIQTIQEARRLKNSELTKLGRLQTSYSEALESTGLKRGVRNNVVERISPAEHIKRINTPIANLPKVTTIVPKSTVSDDLKESLGLETAHSKAVDQREEERFARLNAGLKQLKVLEAKSIELDIVKQLADNQKESLMQQSELIKSLRDKVSTLNSELKVEKSVVDALRKTPLKDIADRLEYDGPMIWKGSIDMVKDLGKLTYNESVAWLHHEFGSEVTTAAAIQQTTVNIKKSITHIEENNTPRPETAPELAKRLEMTKQLDALNADKYRITLMGEGELMSYNVGKNKGTDSSELFYNKDELIKQIPFLSKENRRGYNVFITPFSETVNYLFVDDLNNETLGKLKTAGYEPATVVKSSPKSIQAVLVTDVQASRPVLNAVFRELNHQYGDQKILAQVHPFRLAGFTNRKAKHRNEVNGLYPFVSIVECAKVICKKAGELLTRFAAFTDVAKVPHTKQSKVDVEAVLRPNIDVSGVDVAPGHAALAQNFYRAMAFRYGDEIDYSRADWMLCNKLKKQGVANDQIAAVLLQCSPNIDQRHQHHQAVDYASRTARNAYEIP